MFQGNQSKKKFSYYFFIPAGCKMRELQKAKEKETEINERIRVGGDYYETHRADRRESARRAGGLGSSPVSGRSPGEGDGNPLQYSCLENPMAMGWQRVGHH